MVIERKKPWGVDAVAPITLKICATDREIGQSSVHDILVLTGGDLWRSLGQPPAVQAGQQCTQLDIDALVAKVTRADGQTETMCAVSSIVVGHWLSSVGYACVLNTGFVERLNLAPKAHPNDGRAEMFRIEPNVSIRQRLMMRRRARSGNHLPHPGASVTSSDSFSVHRMSQRQSLSIDGQRIDDWISCDITVDPDHWHVVL